MSFLDSPFVRRSMEEAEFLKARVVLQTEIVIDSKGEDEEIYLEFLHTLYALVESEHLLYTRLRLSNDTEALIAASQLDGSIVASQNDGFVSGDDFYHKLKSDIKLAIARIEGFDPDDLSDFL